MEDFIKLISPLMNGNVFALGLVSFFFGILIMLLDFILFILRGSSLLQIVHKEKLIRDIPTIFLWAGGSGIVGILGGICKIFNPEGLLQTSVFIAIAWPLIIKNLIRAQNEQSLQDSKDPSH